jgi:hypothetical protein
MIPSPSISSPRCTSSSSSPDLETAGLSLDPAQGPAQDFEGLIGQQERVPENVRKQPEDPAEETDKPDPLPLIPVSELTRQPALNEWPWPMIRWNLASPDANPDAELVQGADGGGVPASGSLLPPLPPVSCPRAGSGDLVASPLAGQPELPGSANGARSVIPTPWLPSATTAGFQVPAPADTNPPTLSPLVAGNSGLIAPAISEADQASLAAARTERTNRTNAIAVALAGQPELPGSANGAPSDIPPPLLSSTPDGDPSASQESAPTATPPGQLPKDGGAGVREAVIATAGEGRGRKTPPEAKVSQTGEAKLPPAVSGWLSGTEARPTAVPKSAEPLQTSFANVPQGGLHETSPKETGLAPKQEPARIGEQKNASGEASLPSPPVSLRGPGSESPPVISGVTAAGGFTGPRISETSAAGHSDLSSIMARVWEAAETLPSSHRGRIDLDVPLRDNENVRVRVELRSGEIHATIRTDSQELREALEKSWPEFANKTNERGLRLGDANFSPMRQEGSGGQSGEGSRRDPYPEQQNAWQQHSGGQHSGGGRPSQAGRPLQRRSAEDAPSGKVPPPAGPVTLWA